MLNYVYLGISNIFHSLLLFFHQRIPPNTLNNPEQRSGQDVIALRNTRILTLLLETQPYIGA